MATEIKRREFISIAGGATLWPFSARAQLSEKIRRVGVLPAGYQQADPEGEARVTAFHDTLHKLGWSEDRNIQLEIRWSSNEIERIRMEATALVASAGTLQTGGAAAALKISFNKNLSPTSVEPDNADITLHYDIRKPADGRIMELQFRSRSLRIVDANISWRL